MVSPLGQTPTYASDNKNGFLASLLAWIRGPKSIIGGRDFRGFYVWDPVADAEHLEDLPNACKVSLTQSIKCDAHAKLFLRSTYRGSLANKTLADSVCAENCGESLQDWFDDVAANCVGYTVLSSSPTKAGGQIWSGWNETCLTDPETGRYCNDVIDDFTKVDRIEDLSTNELCSFCFVERLETMQRSPYSVYDESFQEQLEVVYEKCPASGSSAMPPSLDAPPEFPPDPICVTGEFHTTLEGDTCDSIALKYNVSSAALFMANSRQSVVCDHVEPGMKLCLPIPCTNTYVVQPNDTCVSIEVENNYEIGDVRRYNPWVEFDCSNLHTTASVYGHVICLGNQGGSTYTATAPIPGVTLGPGEHTGYVEGIVAPPSNATVAGGTTLRCGKWHVAVEGESCPAICILEYITAALFLKVNPSLSSADCTGSLVPGRAYCVGPNPGWKKPLPSPTSLPASSAKPVARS